MKLILDANVSRDVVRGACDVIRYKLSDEQPLNDLETLGWLVLSHNLSVLTTASTVTAAAVGADENLVGAQPQMNPNVRTQP